MICPNLGTLFLLFSSPRVRTCLSARSSQRVRERESERHGGSGGSTQQSGKRWSSSFYSTQGPSSSSSLSYPFRTCRSREGNLLHSLSLSFPLKYMTLLLLLLRSKHKCCDVSFDYPTQVTLTNIKLLLVKKSQGPINIFGT